MSDSEVKKDSEKKDSSKQTGKWAAFKKEFKKIIWPDKKTAGKETAEVIVISIILGLVIAGIDLLIKLGLDRIFLS